MVAQILDSGPAETSAFRPAPKGAGLGRWLRTRIGVDEEVLDYAPELRPHYTKVGALVLTTSALASVSMLTALVKFLDVFWLLLLPVAAFWGWVIYCIDSWLITTMHGTHNNARAFWVRLALAALLGLFIAEPLLLKVFEPAIHRQVRDTRLEERTERESALVSCNPVPYAEPPAADRAHCQARGLLLTVRADPGSVAAELAELQNLRKVKQAGLDGDKKRLRTLQDDAREECNGQSGPGLSGEFGNGPRCKEAHRDVLNHPRETGMAAQQQKIQELDGRINALIADQQGIAQRYAAEVDAGIRSKLLSANGDIGLLEEHKALGALTGESLLVLVGPWVLRALLVVIDCLPVLTKRLSGPTAYDRMISERIGTGEELFELDNQLRRRNDRAAKESALNELDRFDRDLQHRRHVEEERSRVRQDDELNRRIDEYARRLRGEI